jgi:hypothetical protein
MYPLVFNPPGMPSKCLGAATGASTEAACLLQSIENRSRQPVLWAPPTVLDPAISHPRPSTECRARTTTVATLGAAQNGTSRRVRPAGPPVTSNAIFGRRW